MINLKSKFELLISATVLSVVLLFASCDRKKYSKSDVITVIDISTPSIEKHAKKGIEISEEEHEEILLTVKSKGLLNDKD